MSARHSWGLPERFPLKTERACLNGCGIVKVTRHEGGRHWQEFWSDCDGSMSAARRQFVSG